MMYLAANSVSTAGAVVLTSVIVAVIAGVIVLAVASSKKNRLRRAAIAAWLQSRGLRVSPGPVAREILGPIESLAARSEKAIWSGVGSIEGIQVVAIEHTYSTGSGKSRHTHNHSVISIALPTAWPTLSVTAEHFLHRIGEMFGMRDIRLDDEAFNKRFRVKCEDENFALLLLNPEVQALMMTWDKRACLAVRGDRLCVYTSRHLEEAEWRAFLDGALALRAAIAPELDNWGA